MLKLCPPFNAWKLKEGLRETETGSPSLELNSVIDPLTTVLLLKYLLMDMTGFAAWRFIGEG